METAVSRYQGDTKVMAWVALIDGKALRVRWMQDDEGRNVNVTGDSYQEMIQHDVWPEVQYHARRNTWWMQQDGASVHCKATTNDLEQLFQ